MEPEVKFVDSAPVCNFLLQELRLSSSPTASSIYQPRALADEARATFARVSKAVGLGSEAEKSVWAALKAERVTYIDRRAPDFLAGRDDATFVCRERQTS